MDCSLPINIFPVSDFYDFSLGNQQHVRYHVRMKKYITATEARKKFYDVINDVQSPVGEVIITHKGLPRAVIMSFEEYEGLLETMEIMSDPELCRELKKDLKDIKAGNLHKHTTSLDKAKKKLKR